MYSLIKMALEKYKQKRNFKNTPEPPVKSEKSNGALKFVIQRHAASRLHYDFRLELEGVLKSWAVPKGPSLNPNDKRLAMMVEDHPFSYRTFEGVIPEGNYGAGIVEIWDEGTYHSIESEDKNISEKQLLEQLHNGNLKFTLHGKKLNGEFALVKIKNDTKNAWLLIKHRDKYATTEDYSSEDHVPADSRIKKATKNASVKTTADHFHEPSKKPESTYGTDPMPHEVKPMLAKVKEKPFDEKGWLFEVKWDGYRAIAEIKNGEANLYSRNLIPFNKKYPPIARSLAAFDCDAVLDGEIVILDEDGHADFQALQHYDEDPSPNLYYYVFDILYLNGFDLTGLPLLERKKYLRQIFPDLRNIKYSDHIENEGIAFFELAKKQHLEGIMAKRADSFYNKGSRSDQWLKIKIVKKQEAVICGYTAPRNSRKGFGALILGVYEKGRLVYIGHTGGGFDNALLKSMKTKLDALVQEKSPFDVKIKTNEKVTWVQPKLVCEIAFSGWTEEAHMRHPIFEGIRIDKTPEEVSREIENNGAMELKDEKIKSDHSASAFSKDKNNVEVESNGHKLKITNLHKIYWPEEGYKKEDVINYYQQTAGYILPYLKDRPQSLNRHPNGILEPNFFQKDMGENLPLWLKTVEIFSESNSKNIHYLVCQDADTLMYINNLGCIEINTWHSKIQSLENPDYSIIDLDPGENSFDEVVETALAVKSVLDKAGAECFVKTSGATGIHIYVPLGGLYDYDQSKNFAHIIVQLVHDQLPKLTSLERSPKARRKQIYLDYLQNRTGQTLAVPYSIRPKPGATVSTPLEWNEVKKGLHPSQFDITTIHKRLDEKGDLFKGILGKGIDMKKCLENLNI